MPCGDFPLSSKVVLVTGGGSGINLAFVKLALKHQARGIIIGDLKLNAEAEDLVQQNSSSVGFVKCDVTKRKDLEALISASVQKFDEVPDVYIAGAGVFEPDWSNWWDDTEEDRYAELDINTTHALKLSRIAVRSLVAKGKKGVILIVASLAGYAGTFSAPLYCASKHAVIGFVRSMAQLDEMEGIKIVSIAPGFVATPLWTTRPDIMQQYGYDEELTVTPGQVAEAMVKLVAEGRYGGGASLEISKQTIRELGTWSIAPPPGVGTTVPKEAMERNLAPLREVLDKDRQTRL